MKDNLPTRVLIADDDATSRLILASMLSKLGYDPVCVKDGLSAWRELERDRGVKLALLDWIMPGLEGLEVCRRLARRPDAEERFVVMVSARDGQKDQEACRLAGADAFLTKPVDRESLADCLDQARRKLAGQIGRQGPL